MPGGRQRKKQMYKKQGGTNVANKLDGNLGLISLSEEEEVEGEEESSWLLSASPSLPSIKQTNRQTDKHSNRKTFTQIGNTEQPGSQLPD